MRHTLKTIFVLFTFLLSGCFAYVEQGYTGIEAANFGGEKGGVTEHTPGRYFYTPWNTDAYTFPNFVQTESWTSDNHEALKVLSGDQMEFTVDLGLSYFVNSQAGCSAEIFRKYRKDIRDITSGPIRLTVKDEVQSVFSQYDADHIYGNGRTEVLNEVKERVKESLLRLSSVDNVACFVVDDLYLMRLEPPATVKDAVNAKIAQTQRAQQAVEETKRIEEEAKQAKIRAEMEALNNRQISQSLTPEILRNKFLEKWDGKLPSVMSDDAANLILNLNN
jgi:regulator of protease activity HflC (stomatin/prohibitin superfamily)